MKRLLKLYYLPLATLAGGLLAMLFRSLMWVASIGDETSALLATGRWPDVLSWVTVAVMMAFLFLATWRLQGGNKYRTNFPPSILAAAGMLAAALSICISSITELQAGVDTVSNASAIVGFLAAAALVFLAYGRLKGFHFSILFHGIICIYLMLYLISHYRLWSSFPQLQSYAFDLLAVVFLMLACYHRAAFDADSGKRRPYTFFSMAALFFCIAALPGCDNAVFLVGCALWMLATPCKLTSVRSRPKEE